MGRIRQAADAADLREPRIRLVPFEEITVGTVPAFLIKGLIPRVGLTIVWGPPKSGKSFWIFDAMMHVALGWEYRGRRVQQGPIVYVAAEGAEGFKARVEGFRQNRMAEAIEGRVPFYLVPVNLDMLAEHAELIGAVRLALADTVPAAVVLDTLNRTLVGSETEDMPAYVRAADAIRTAFGCAVTIVHHCGVDGTRPRGHTSLTGAADAQIAIKRAAGGNVVATVEWMKDGPEGDAITSRLVPVNIGTDTDGDTITTCIVEPVEDTEPVTTGPRLSRNQTTMFTILHDAGGGGLTVEDWNERAREVGIGTKRKADLYDLREALKRKRVVHEYGGKWFAETKN